ncbi:hypothetical protein KEM55_009169, partial [Ascosphaera atra]
ATWDAAKQAARLRPDVNATPATWADFETCILNRFDELNAKARLLGEFKHIRQHSDIQAYASEFQIAYGLCSAEWGHESLLTHFIDSLRPDLQSEWKRLRDKPASMEETITELIRLEDVLNTARRASGGPRFGFGRRPDSARLNLMPAEDNPPKKDSPMWNSWCRKNFACFRCGSKAHRFADCVVKDKTASTSGNTRFRRDRRNDTGKRDRNNSQAKNGRSQ